MISEFNDLSDKIDRLAELTLSLRRENATLRQSNALLAAENIAFMERLGEAQRRVEALLSTIPTEPGDEEFPDDDAISDGAHEDATVDATADTTITDEAAR